MRTMEGCFDWLSGLCSRRIDSAQFANRRLQVNVERVRRVLWSLLEMIGISHNETLNQAKMVAILVKLHCGTLLVMNSPWFTFARFPRKTKKGKERT